MKLFNQRWGQEQIFTRGMCIKDNSLVNSLTINVLGYLGILGNPFSSAEVEVVKGRCYVTAGQN